MSINPVTTGRNLLQLLIPCTLLSSKHSSFPLKITLDHHLYLQLFFDTDLVFFHFSRTIISHSLPLFFSICVSVSLCVMGNYISCTLANSAGRQSRGAKVILPSGEIRQLDGHVKAAELMFEIPNYFLVNSRSLQIGRRFSALSAVEDLEMGNVYIMFPMKRVNSVIKAADMGALFMSANRAANRASSAGAVCIVSEAGNGNAQVTPVPAVDGLREGETPLPRLKLDDVEEFSTPEFKHRRSMCKSRKPLLETIMEEPISSR